MNQQFSFSDKLITSQVINDCCHRKAVIFFFLFSNAAFRNLDTNANFDSLFWKFFCFYWKTKTNLIKLFQNKRTNQFCRFVNKNEFKSMSKSIQFGFENNALLFKILSLILFKIQKIIIINTTNQNIFWQDQSNIFNFHMQKINVVIGKIVSN